VQLSSGYDHNCAIRIDGSLACWGSNTNGEINAPAGTFQQVTSGGAHSCAIRSDASVACWGANNDGQTNAPSGQFVQISSRTGHTCGVRPDHSVTCWGFVSGGLVPPAGTFKEVGAGGFHNCALRTTGQLVCWGANNYGQAPRPAIQPATLPGGTTSVAYSQSLSLVDSINYLPPAPVFTLASGNLPASVSLSGSGVVAGTPTATGPFGFVVEANDANGFQAQQAYSVTVVQGDSTPPSISPTITGTLGSNGWYRSSVTVSWSVTDAQSPVGPTTGCNTATLTTDTSGAGLTCTATSAGGTASVTATIKIDRTAPVLSPSVSPNPLLLHAVATGSAGGQDATAGVATQSCAALNTNTVGQKQATCTATDAAGNSASAVLSYGVVFGFVGFEPTMLSPPGVNRVTGGKTVLFRWRVVDANGVGVTTLTNWGVDAPPVTCSTVGATIRDAPLGTGSTKLQNLGNGNYAALVKTPKVRSSICQIMRLNLQDGLTHPIYILLLQ
jgi:hypothetical protein